MYVVIGYITKLNYTFITLAASAKAVYPLIAVNEDELTLKVNDHITNIQWDRDGSTWALGTCNGKTGFFHTACTTEYNPLVSRLQYLQELTKGRGKPDGHEVHYEGNMYISKEKPQDWVSCIICTELASVPVQTGCCGSSFCLKCIEEWAKSSATCPHCRKTRKDGFSFNKDLRTERLIKDLKLFCTNYNSGCEWNGELRDVADHLAKTCQFEAVPCPLKCLRKLPRFQMKRHVEEECPLRKIKCPFAGCNRSITYKSMIEVHYQECLFCPVRCPNHCKDRFIVRMDKERHLTEECMEAIIDCEFAEFGCNCQAKRKDMPNHLEEAVHFHLSMLLKDYRKLQQKVESIDLSKD